MKKIEIEKLSKKWKANARTIQRWIADGAPLADKEKMFSWLSGRKNIPSGTAELLAANRKSRAIAPPLSEVGLLGAGAALERLEKAEAEAFLRFCDAVNAGDAFSVKSTRSTWLSIGENLRKYHRQVEDYDRPGGETIARGEVENYLHGVSFWLNSAFRQMSRELVELHRLNMMPSTEDFFELLSRIYLTALASASTYKCKTTISRWVYKAMTNVSPFKAPADCVEADRIVFVEIIAKLKKLGEKNKPL